MWRSNATAAYPNAEYKVGGKRVQKAMMLAQLLTCKSQVRMMLMLLVVLLLVLFVQLLTCKSQVDATGALAMTEGQKKSVTPPAWDKTQDCQPVDCGPPPAVSAGSPACPWTAVHCHVASSLRSSG